MNNFIEVAREASDKSYEEDRLMVVGLQSGRWVYADYEDEGALHSFDKGSEVYEVSGAGIVRRIENEL